MNQLCAHEKIPNNLHYWASGVSTMSAQPKTNVFYYV